MINETYFQIEGEFLGVCALDGYKLKYLRLRSVERDFLVKIPKELRGGMVYKLSIGDQIRCEGIQKDLKFKAYSIEKIDLSTPVAQLKEHTAKKAKVKILICQSSDCLKYGGKELYSALNEQLHSHNLNDSVALQSTGCLKCCKQAPNLLVLPDRSSYHNVRIAQIPAVISKVRHQLTTLATAIDTDDRADLPLLVLFGVNRPTIVGRRGDWGTGGLGEEMIGLFMPKSTRDR